LPTDISAPKAGLHEGAEMRLRTLEHGGGAPDGGGTVGERGSGGMLPT